MQLVIQIAEWIIWAAATLVGLGNALSGAADPGARMLMRQSGILMLIGAGVTLALPVSKFHLLWIVPAAIILPGWWMALRLQSAFSRTDLSGPPSVVEQDEPSDEPDQTDEEFDSIQEEVSKIERELRTAETNPQRQRLMERLELLTGLLDRRDSEREEELARLERMLELEEQLAEANAERERLHQEVVDTLEGLRPAGGVSQSSPPPQQ